MFTGIFTEPDARLHVQWVNEAQVEGIGEQVYFKKRERKNMGKRRRRRPAFGGCDKKWFNRCCCNIKKSFDEIYKMLNP